MKAFRFERPANLAQAARAAVADPAVLHAGGTDLLDRMKERVDEPDRVVALAGVLGRTIGVLSVGTLVLDAGVTLADLETSQDVGRWLPALVGAASMAASPQIRNRATLGGNLVQHTRCGYYRHRSFPCLKRGDPSCPVLEPGAVQETAGIFGNESCACAHPSSIAPVLLAAKARVVVAGPTGEERVLPLADLYRPPERGKAWDHTLARGEVIVRIEVSARRPGERTAFEEIRQKASFDWALVSCGVSLYVAEGKIADAAVWLGSVAPTPWRAQECEKALLGAAADEKALAAAAAKAAVGARPLPGNAYKSALVEVAVRRALLRAAGRG